MRRCDSHPCGSVLGSEVLPPAPHEGREDTNRAVEGWDSSTKRYERLWTMSLGGAEILEAGGSGLAELPGQGRYLAGPQLLHELPTGVGNSVNPQFAQSGDKDSWQPNIQGSHSNSNIRGGNRV